MKKIVSGIVCMIVLCLPLYANAEIGYSGASWGELRHEAGDGIDNTLLYGWIDQGIDWTEKKGFRVSTYGVLRYKLDTRKLWYNNSIAPGLGIAVRKRAIKIGAEYIWERYFESDTSENKAVIYINWWTGWDLKR